MRRIVLLFGIMMVLLLCACGPKTTVVLVPDDSGNVGEIEVSGTKGTERISGAYQYTEVGGADAPADVKLMPEEEAKEIFGDALQVAPKPAVSFMLYFYSDAVRMKAESKERLSGIIKAIQERMPAEISIIGHSDRVANKEYNLALSFKRANAIKQLLAKKGVPSDSMTVYSHGENDPLVPTADGVAEARNRRVEIFVR